MERFFAKKFGKSKMSSLVELGRPWNSIIVILLSFLGILLSNNPQVIPFNFLIISIIIFLMYTGSAALNDLYDIKVDSINMPFRPIQRDSIKRGDVITFCFFSYMTSIILALTVSMNFFLSIILMAVLSIIYSMPPFSLKDRGFMGNLNLAFSTILTTMYSGYVLATNSLIPETVFLIEILSLVSLFTFFSILKDFKDIKGDKIHNKKTTTIKRGIKDASKINILGTILSSVIVIVSFFFRFQNILFVLSSFLLFVSIIFLEINVYRNPSEKTGEVSWSRGRIVFFLFILSLFLFV